ncbi:MAG: hypothetical protein WCG23_02350 [bacterium]
MQNITNQPFTKQICKPSFNGVNIFRSHYTGVPSVGIWVDKNKDLVTFVDGRMGQSSLGHSKTASSLVNMVKRLGQEVTDPKNIEKIRKKVTGIVKEFEVQLGEHIKPSSVEEADLHTVIQKGNPTYSPAGSKLPTSKEVLSFNLDLSEEVTIKVPRSKLTGMGIKQP